MVLKRKLVSKKFSRYVHAGISYLWSSANCKKTGSYCAVPAAFGSVCRIFWELCRYGNGSRSNIVCVSNRANRIVVPSTRMLNADSSIGSKVVAIIRYLPGSMLHLWLIWREFVYCEFKRLLCFLKNDFGRHSVTFVWAKRDKQYGEKLFIQVYLKYLQRTIA